MAKLIGASLDELAGLSASADPELARLLARLSQLPEEDRAFIRRALPAGGRSQRMKDVPLSASRPRQVVTVDMHELRTKKGPAFLFIAVDAYPKW